MVAFVRAVPVGTCRDLSFASRRVRVHELSRLCRRCSGVTAAAGSGGAIRQRPRIVVIGAGFGGLAATRHLSAADADVTLVDRHNYHLFQPLLYQVATAALSSTDIAVPIRTLLRGQRNVEVLLGEVVGVEASSRKVKVGQLGELPYDYLVCATGAEYNYFGHPQWRSVAPGLKSVDDATLVRRRVLLAFERAETAADRQARQRWLTFVLIGAGPTGVEMAGALVELARAALACDFRRIDARAVSIVLVEAGPQVLAGFPDRLAAFAQRSLRQMGVDVRLNTRVEAIDTEGVTANGERIEAATTVWCAGVKATPVAHWLGVSGGRGGRIEVNEDLTVPGHPDIFVIGDAASLTDPSGRPLPGLAPVAKQQGRYVAELIKRRLRGQPPPPPFRYHDEGSLAVIGRASAVADLGRVKLTGWVAWLLWGAAHIFFLISFRHRVAVFFNWFWSWLTYSGGARIITGDSEAGVGAGLRADAVEGLPSKPEAS